MPNLEKQQLTHLTEKQVQSEFGIPHNSLRASRTTGLLWGKKAPSFLKLSHKVLYKRETIEDWFNQFEEVNNTAEVRMGV
ncbi:MAG: DNA-binding protein [Pseudomonadota bacterium]|nr:DNA-binding protein [Pseudomonadota bacterium]